MMLKCSSDVCLDFMSHPPRILHKMLFLCGIMQPVNRVQIHVYRLNMFFPPNSANKIMKNAFHDINIRVVGL